MLGAFVAVAAPGLRGWLDRWAPLADWLVALGTLVLAFATFRLATRARQEAKAVGAESKQVAEQVTLQREQKERAGRAYVFPETPYGWAAGGGQWQDRRQAVLPLKNAGPGAALNVSGRAYWPLPAASGEASIYGGSIAPGDSAEARFSRQIVGWPNFTGYVRYTDENGQEWVTHFKCSTSDTGHLLVQHEAPIKYDPREIERRYPPRPKP